MTVKYDEAMRLSRTERARLYAEAAVRRAEAYNSELAGFDTRSGANRRKREARRECLYCYYIRGPVIAGQAFTDYKCWCCDAEGSHANTAVPMLCNACADEHDACVRCGAQRDLRLPDEEEKTLTGRHARPKRAKGSQT